MSPDLKMGIILAVLKHSGKIPSYNELLKSIETVGEIRDAKTLYINTGIFMRSVDLFLHKGTTQTVFHKPKVSFLRFRSFIIKTIMTDTTIYTINTRT